MTGEPISQAPVLQTPIRQDPILQANDLARHYTVSNGIFAKPSLVRALDGVSFELKPQRTLAVVGESGCGKSTLARILTMIEPQTRGQLAIDGMAIEHAPKDITPEMRRTVQIIFQDPFGSLNPRKKVGTIIGEPLVINEKLSRAERKSMVLDIMAKVGLRPEHYDRYPHMFSGGQRQRIAIARALVLRPKIIIADEPVSALDVSIQAQVLNLLMDLQDELGLAYIFISHDLSVVRHIADDVMVMYLGRAVEHGPVTEIFTAPKHPYTRALLASTPHISPDARTERIVLSGELPSPLAPPRGCAFHTRCPHAKKICGEDRPQFQTLDKTRVACHFAGELASGHD